VNGWALVLIGYLVANTTCGIFLIGRPKNPSIYQPYEVIIMVIITAVAVMAVTS